MFIRIGPGLSLGYRRNQVAGTWVLRIADGQGGAPTRAIGTADDFTEADGANVLNYWQAQEKAQSVARSSSGQDAPKPLTVGRAAEVKTVCSGRGPDEPLLRRGDGARWNRSHQQRRMATALQRAGLDQEGTFYAIRHSYISRAIEGEVPLNIIADNCGTSVRIVEATYAKVLANKRRDFIERGAPTLMEPEVRR